MKHKNTLDHTQPRFSGTVIPLMDTPTMRSLEMVDYINAERQSKAEAEGLSFPCKKHRKLRHDSLMQKVPKVLGESQSPKFYGDYTDEKGRTYPCFHFPKREACLIAMSYSYELQAQVFDHMTGLEGQNSGEIHDAIQYMENIVATAWKVSDEDSSDAGRRLRKRKDDLPVLKTVEKLVHEIRQFPLELIGGGKIEDNKQ